MICTNVHAFENLLIFFCSAIVSLHQASDEVVIGRCDIGICRRRQRINLAVDSRCCCVKDPRCDDADVPERKNCSGTCGGPWLRPSPCCCKMLPFLLRCRRLFASCGVAKELLLHYPAFIKSYAYRFRTINDEVSKIRWIRSLMKDLLFMTFNIPNMTPGKHISEM